jgi:UDP-glucose 4-epimerase
MKKILITGASGLLGRYICNRLVPLGVEVYAITRVVPANPLQGVRYYPIDLSSHWFNDNLPSEVDAVVHLAQSSKFRDFPDSATHVFKVNIESTARLLDYAKRAKARQFIYASSGGVYGGGTNPFSESSNCFPPSKQLGYYLGTKMCGELLVHSYADMFSTVVVRPFFVYGAGQNRSMLIPRLIDSIAAGKSINIKGENGIRINPVHAEDAAEAIVAALSLTESATFNIAGPEVLSIREICEGIGKHIEKIPLFQLQVGVPDDLVADITAMSASLIAPQKRLFDMLFELA